MSFLCKLGLHAWSYCICKRCGEERKGAPHNFKNCKCTACDKEQHAWTGDTCRICGKTKAYGLSPSDPILCGGGPAGERAYLDRVRCPNGKRVDYESRRRGSCSTTDMVFLGSPGVRFSPGGIFAQAPEDEYTKRVCLDIYTLVCECGEHEIGELFMDMYHKGAERPPAVDGWTLG